MQSESAAGEELQVGLPLSLSQITAFRNGEDPDQSSGTVNEREVWAICKVCCAALSENDVSVDFTLCPQSVILQPDGNVTIIKAESSTEFQAPEVTTSVTITEKALVYSLGKTLLYLKKDWPRDSALDHLLHNLTSDDPSNRLTLTEVAQLSSLSLQRSLGHSTNKDEEHHRTFVPKIQDVNENNSREADSSEDGDINIIRHSTKDNIKDSIDPQLDSVLDQPPQGVRALLGPVLKGALRGASSQDKMAAGGNLGPPSLEAFGNLSERAQEILRKIYTIDSSPQSESNGIPKGGSESNLTSYSNGARYFTSDSQGKLVASNPPAKRNSIGSTPGSSLMPQNVGSQEHGSRRYSVGAMGTQNMRMGEELNVSPVPIITVSRPESETPPLSEGRQKSTSLPSAVTAQVSSALTKFMKSRQTTGGSKSEESTFDEQETQRVSERSRKISVDYSSSVGTDDENSSLQFTDGELHGTLADPFTETESEAEPDSNYSNRMRSHSIATCNTFNSKSSAFRATHSKAVRKKSVSSNLTEIQEDQELQSSTESAGTLHGTEASSSAYSNIKDLAMLRNKASNESAQKSSDLVSSATHFTPIVLSDIKSPVMDEAKVKAKKAMELIKLDLKAPKQDKPPPTMLEDLENDATEYVEFDQGNCDVKSAKNSLELPKLGDKQNVKKSSGSTENQTTPELTTDQKLKLLFEKHGLGSPNPSPCPSPNQSPKSVVHIPSRTLAKAIPEEIHVAGKKLSSPVALPISTSVKVKEDDTNLNKIKQESSLLIGKSKISHNENSISPIYKKEPVTLVQNSPLNMGIGFAPIFKPKEETKSDSLLGISSEDVVAARKSPLTVQHNSSCDGNMPQNRSLVCNDVRARTPEKRKDVQVVQQTTPCQDKEEAKSSMTTVKRTTSDTSTDIKCEETNVKATLSTEPLKIANVNGETMLNETTDQEKPNAQQVVQSGSVVSFEASSALQDTASQLAMQNLPIQVQLHQDPQTGLYRVVPMGSPLQGLPAHVSSSGSTPTSPIQSVTSSHTTKASPVQINTSSPSSHASSSSSVKKPLPRKKKIVDTSSDPDSLVLPNRHQYRSMAERKKDHTKKRAERTKYSVSPHKKSFAKLPMSNLITDSESSESSFSSPVPTLGLEKSQVHVRPHRRKPKSSPASSSHGDSDQRKERHRDQLNASRSPQVERVYQEHVHRSPSKSREKSVHTPPSHTTTPTCIGEKNKIPHVKSSHHNRSHSAQAPAITIDDTDDTRPVDHTLMPSSPISVSMSSASRDSGVHLRYTTSSGEDLPMMQEAHLADALQSNSNLKKVIRQIRQAFAFDGYLENGVEDLHMAEYISSLASVTFTTFSSAVTEKFCDLYWEEELLEGLYEAVNGQKPTKLTDKSSVPSQKHSEVRRKSKDLILQDTKTLRDNSASTPRGRAEGKRSSSDKTSSNTTRKTTSKSTDISTKHEEGMTKSKERLAQRKSSEGIKDGKGPRKGTRIEGKTEREPSSSRRPRSASSSRKLTGEGNTDRVIKQKQDIIDSAKTIPDRLTDKNVPETKRVPRRREVREKTDDRENVGHKEEKERKKLENSEQSTHKISQNERKSNKIRVEEAVERRTRKVSADSSDGRTSRNNQNGRLSAEAVERRTRKISVDSNEGRASRNSQNGTERRVRRVSHETRENNAHNRASGSAENLDTVGEEDRHKHLNHLNRTNTPVNQQTRKPEERNDENGNMKSQESLLMSSKDSSCLDHLSSHDSLTDHYTNDSLYLSSTSELSSSLPLPKQHSTHVLNTTLPITKSELTQARLAPPGSGSPSLLSGSRRDSVASFSSTSSGTSSRTHQSFATNSLGDSLLETSLEESRLVMPSVLYSGDKVDPSVAEYTQSLTGSGETQNSIESKISEVDQQLTLEKRSQKKTAKFYRKLQEKVSAENKGIASKVGQELAETNQKIEFLESAKRHLEMLYAEQWGLDFSLLYSFATISNDEMLIKRADNPLLTMHTMRTITTLQAGEPKGLFSYLYARQALLDGYLPHFFYTYHYFATSQQLLDFITSRFILACQLKMRSVEDDVTMSIIARTIDILHVWVEGFFDVDFKPYPQFMQELLTFVSDQMVPVEQQSRFLLQLLERRQQDAVNGLTSVAARVHNSDNSLPAVSKPALLPWQQSPINSQSEKSGGGFKASLMACFVRKPTKEPLAYTPAPHIRREGFHMSDHTSYTIAQILTLIQQALFIQVHPIHYLNSRSYSISVKDTAKSPYSLHLQPSPLKGDGEGGEAKSLFTQKVFEGKEIRDLLDLGQVVSHWVSAEVVSSSSAKTQVAILSKFVSAAKTCFELRNFASCVQILDGLNNVIVRQVPAWRDLPSKMVTIYEDLNSSRVLLQGDSEYLVRGEKTSPTLPATLLFLLHVQQLEIGGFQLTNGMFKWTKLRSIAKLVDQIRVFQEASYSFDLDPSLPGQLKQRMEEFSSQDIHVLAARHSSNYHQLSSDKGHKFTSAFQKMKAGLH